MVGQHYTPSTRDPCVGCTLQDRDDFPLNIRCAIADCVAREALHTPRVCVALLLSGAGQQLASLAASLPAPLGDLMQVKQCGRCRQRGSTASRAPSVLQSSPCVAKPTIPPVGSAEGASPSFNRLSPARCALLPTFRLPSEK